MDMTSRSAISALSSWERIGTAESEAVAPCSIKSPTTWAIPYILRPRSITTMAALAGSRRMALPLIPKGVIALDIGNRLPCHAVAEQPVPQIDPGQRRGQLTQIPGRRPHQLAKLPKARMRRRHPPLLPRHNQRQPLA